MSRQTLLLINPRITARRNARFPLSLLTLAGEFAADYRCIIIDGNVDGDPAGAVRAALAAGEVAAACISVMGGPQVATAIALSKIVRAASPATPIVWGGYFPTLYPAAALNAGYVDYLVRGPGEQALRGLLAAGDSPAAGVLAGIDGLSWKRAGVPAHNRQRRLSGAQPARRLPYELLADPRRYRAGTFLGQATVAHQAALGCRFRCSFCGVAAMFRGATVLPPAAVLERDLRWLRAALGADSVQFYDHNFFEREADMLPLLEVLARIAMPWWCYARADALLQLSPAAWRLVEQSRLRMAYIGAESPSDALLHDIRKGTTAAQTIEVAKLCRSHGVVPEFSFMVAPPVDPEGETERTFEFIRQVKRANPDAEIIVYVYTPVPADAAEGGVKPARQGGALLDLHGEPVIFPRTPEQWTEQRWVDYACHADAPWLSAALRQRIRDFVTVLRCRFPTAQDQRTSTLAKGTLRALADWRYRFRRYGKPWELTLAQQAIRLADPRATGI
jgi:anaerobic magnesium-protoporphyrin IX monomethyl ester cyclase